MDQYYTVKEYPLESSAGGQSVYSVTAPGDVSFSAYFRIKEHAEDMAWVLNRAREQRKEFYRNLGDAGPSTAATPVGLSLRISLWTRACPSNVPPAVVAIGTPARRRL